MKESSSHSVTQWLPALKQSDPEAVKALFDRFFKSIVQTASRHLKNMPRRVADEEDVAMSAVESVCFAASDHRCSKLEDRNDLQKMLFTKVRDKSVKISREACAQKRGSGKVRGESVFEAFQTGSFDGGLDVEDFREFEAEFIASIRESFERLPDEMLQTIALLRTEGWEICEIAKKVELTERSVYRKLDLIRDSWAKEFDL